MNRIINMCLKDIRGYTPRSVFELMKENVHESHIIFELQGAYMLIGINQKFIRYEKMEEWNGSFENVSILKAIGKFYGIHLEDEIEPFLSEFTEKMKNLDTTKPPVHIY